jgi:putative peptide zinc metalloprotease protein
MSPREHPKLRTDLTWRRFVSEGQDSYIFKDEITQAYVKLDAMSGALALRLDGNTSPEDLLAWARETWTSLDFDADYIADILADLKKYKFIEDPFQRNALLRARAHEERAQINANTFRNIFSISLGTVDPDRFLTRTYPYVRFLFTPVAIGIGLALFLLSAYLVWTNRDHMAGRAMGLLLGGGLEALGILLLWVTLVFTITIHELGHGYAVKHFGGKVTKIGFLFMFGLPCMFCDTSDSHLFPNWKHRAGVALSGTYAELYVATLATLVWWATPADLVVNQLAYNIIVFASISGLAFNFNPLIKLDGYFVLSDVLDQPNLQEDAYGYLGYLFKRHLFGMKDQPCPVEGRQRKRVLAGYALASVVYSLVFGVVMFALLRNYLIGSLAFLGAVIAALLLVFVMQRLSRPLVRGAKAWALDHRGQIRRHQMPIVAGIALLLATFLLLPVPGRRVFAVALEPAREAALVAPEDLQLRQASWSAGQAVAAGQVLAVLDADRAAALGGEQEAEAGALRIRGGVARQSGDDVATVAARAGATAAAERARLLGRRVERSDLRAPFAGRVLTAALAGRVGARFEAGDTLCVVGDFSSVRATAHLWELDLEDLRVGSPAHVRLRAWPGKLLHGRVSVIQPAAQEEGGQRRYEVRITLEEQPSEARAGLTGRAWVATPWRTPAAHLTRILSRFVRLDLWV